MFNTRLRYLIFYFSANKERGFSEIVDQFQVTWHVLVHFFQTLGCNNLWPWNQSGLFMLGLILRGCIRQWMSSHLCQEGFLSVCAPNQSLHTRRTDTLNDSNHAGMFSDWFAQRGVVVALNDKCPTPNGSICACEYPCFWTNWETLCFCSFFPWDFLIYASQIHRMLHKKKKTTKKPRKKTPSPEWIILSWLSGPSVFPLQWFMCFAFSIL